MSQLGWDHLTREDKAAILKGIEDGVAYGGPYHVEFHPQDRCNVDCFFCSTASLRGKDEIPMPRFEELLGELKEMVSETATDVLKQLSAPGGFVYLARNLPAAKVEAAFSRVRQ